MKTGYIYGYYDAMTQKWVYVGQTVAVTRRHRNHMKGWESRFDRELKKRDGTPDAFVGPVILETITVPKAEYPQAMAFQETMWMFHLHTYAPAYARGFNLCIPLSTDYQNLGRLGIRVGSNADAEYVSQRNRKGGQIAGRRNVQSGHLAYARSFITTDQLVERGRILGLLTQAKGTGLFGMTPEQRQAAAKKGGIVGGRKRFELYGNPATADGCAKGGRIGGPKTIAIARAHRTPEMTSKVCELLRHRRWHVKRGIVNPNCKLCAEARVA